MEYHEKIIFLGFFAVGIITVNISHLSKSHAESFSFAQLINITFANNESGGEECDTVMVDQGGDEYLCSNGYYEGEY